MSAQTEPKPGSPNDPRIRQWTKMLRSGVYKQGFGNLYDPLRCQHCCLGVLTLIPLMEKHPERTTKELSECMSGESLPRLDVADWLDLIHMTSTRRASTWDPVVPIPVTITVEDLLKEEYGLHVDQAAGLVERIREGDWMRITCSALNDNHGLTFPQIANLIDHFGIQFSQIK